MYSILYTLLLKTSVGGEGKRGVWIGWVSLACGMRCSKAGGGQAFARHKARQGCDTERTDKHCGGGDVWRLFFIGVFFFAGRRMPVEKKHLGDEGGRSGCEGEWGGEGRAGRENSESGNKFITRVVCGRNGLTRGGQWGEGGGWRKSICAFVLCWVGEGGGGGCVCEGGGGGFFVGQGNGGRRRKKAEE